MNTVKTLSDRYMEIDRDDADNVLAFLYKQDTDMYDERNINDVFKLYMFATTYAKETPHSVQKRVKLMMGTKIPTILKLADRAINIIEEYQSIREYTYVTEEAKDEYFTDFCKNIISMSEEMMTNGYTCYLKSFATDDIQKCLHWVYLAKPSDIEKTRLKIYRILLDGHLDALPIIITYIKPSQKKSESYKKTIEIRKTETGFDFKEN